jgi:hypothetical protein
MRIFKNKPSQALDIACNDKAENPDTIHTDTGQHLSCGPFVTSEIGFRGVAGLSVVILGELLKT